MQSIREKLAATTAELSRAEQRAAEAQQLREALSQTQSDLAHSNERMGAEAAHAATLAQELAEARRLLEREVRLPPFRVGWSGSFGPARLGCPNGRARCGRFYAARAQAVVLCRNPLY